MDIQWLLTFDAILETGTFAKAAEKLGYTQSTVTFQIRQLEQELSIKLFDKIGRKMQLSDAGKKVLPLIRETIDSSERLKHAGQNSSTPTGKLTIAVSASIFKFTPLYDVIARFLEQAPHVDLTVTRKACNDIIDALKDGTIDIGILYQADGLEDPALSITRLQDIHLILAASGAVNTTWDLEHPPTGRMPYYLTDPRCVFHGIYKRYLKQHRLPYNNDTAILDWISTLRGIESGLGIALIPQELVVQELSDGTIRSIPLNELSETVYIAMEVHKNKGRSPAIDLFTQLVSQHFSL